MSRVTGGSNDSLLGALDDRQATEITPFSIGANDSFTLRRIILKSSEENAPPAALYRLPLVAFDAVLVAAEVDTDAEAALASLANVVLCDLDNVSVRCSRIKRATRLSPTQIPSSRKSSWMRGRP